MHSMPSAQAEQQLTDLADQFAHWHQHARPALNTFPPAMGARGRSHCRLADSLRGEALAAAGE